MGKLVAEWIVEGTPSLDVWEMDSRRFGAAYASREYTLARTTEVYSTYYDVKYPGHERQAGRPLRVSPTYGRLQGSAPRSARSRGGARQLVRAQRGRRRRVAAAARLGGEALVGGDRRRAPRLPRGGSPFRRDVVREDRGLRGRRRRLPRRLSANEVARDVGAITYTQMLNSRGGIECDFTVTRLAEERFRIVTGTAFGRHDLAWIASHAPDDGSVAVEDVTSRYACLGLWGPKAREILQPLVVEPLDFPYMRARELAVGPVPASLSASPTSGSSGGSSTARWSSGSASGTSSGLPAADTASSLAATRRSTRSGSRRGIGSGARTSRPRTRRSRPASASRSSSTRASSSGVKHSRRRRPGAEARLPRPRRPARGGARVEPVLVQGQSLGRVTSGGYGYYGRALDRLRVRAVGARRAGNACRVEIFGDRVAAEVVAEPLYDPTAPASAPDVRARLLDERAKSAPSSPSSGCQSTPSANRFSGSSSASTVPSSARAASTTPLAQPAEALVVVRLDGPVAQERRQSRALAHVDLVVGEDARRVLVLLVPHDLGQVLDEVAAARATLSTCEPRQTASTGMSRSSAARRSASSPRSQSGRSPVVSGWASCPYSPGSMSEPPEKRIPSSASSVSSPPRSAGRRPPGHRPARPGAHSASHRTPAPPRPPSGRLGSA